MFGALLCGFIGVRGGGGVASIGQYLVDEVVDVLVTEGGNILTPES